MNPHDLPPVTVEDFARGCADIRAELKNVTAELARTYRDQSYIEIDADLLCSAVKLEVEYDYAPAEPMYGYPEYLDLVSVKLNGVDITDAATGDLGEQIKVAIREAR